MLHSEQLDSIGLGFEETTWQTRRLSVAIPGSFDEVITRFESAVAMYPHEEFDEMVSRSATWDEILARTNEIAPWGFINYWKNDVRRIMAAAGDTVACVAYLMGNHTIAERMFRHDARIMNYAPLHVVITEDPPGTVRFTVDQPSTQFASFGDPAIAEVGLELDTKLIALLAHLGTKVSL